MPGNRDKTGRFVKGVSGNPNGRPKTDPTAKAILEAAVPEAALMIVETMKDVNVPIKVRTEMAKTILDRVLGKASQSIDIETIAKRTLSSDDPITKSLKETFDAFEETD